MPSESVSGARTMRCDASLPSCEVTAAWKASNDVLLVGAVTTWSFGCAKSGRWKVPSGVTIA
ncbi:hypothetical protein GCM10009539_33440 [Cryptosporangium japonicum]|uniref:Uncharacterized protein n=2 Tax=Cryptosporangium japonicum TaxID=80872 RepID=A0ABN0UBS4_9ACTN